VQVEKEGKGDWERGKRREGKVKGVLPICVAKGSGKKFAQPF